MDANPNTGHEPVTPSPLEGAEGPARSDHAAEVSALKAWFLNNAVSLLITAAVVALVCRYLDPIDVIKVVIGLGLVIFIHELGHFLAAKWCDVHVKTFSIGFGPAVPFCQYKWGETTYMIGIIPLGGYVSMVGEGDAAGDDDAEEDPRSFRRKTVGQRMLIISAGVVMNIILGMGCFVAAYVHGVREEPGIVGAVLSGGAAWRSGLEADDIILSIDGHKDPTFKELRPIVMSTRKGEKVRLVIKRGNESFDVDVEPLREEGAYFPALGINAEPRLTLISDRKRSTPPTVPGSPAYQANPAFEQGDRIIGMTDPKDPANVTPLPSDPNDPSVGPDVHEYYRRMAALADRPVTFRVLRRDEAVGGKPVDIVVEPAYRSDLGMRMRMGEVVALRENGPAARAGVAARTTGQAAAPGDRIKTVKLPELDGKETWFTTDDVKEQPNATVHKLDPVILPLELKKWAAKWKEGNPGGALPRVKVVVLRTVDHKDNTPVELTLDYDVAYQNDREVLLLPNSPVPLTGLGLAYWVETIVEEVAKGGAAEQAGVHPGDVVTAVRFTTLLNPDVMEIGKWEDVKVNQWAEAEASFQSRPPHQIFIRVDRTTNGVKEEGIELALLGREDKSWPATDRGLLFMLDFRMITAADAGDALNLGGRRTVRFIRDIYMNLYSMIIGRVSPKTMSGPLTIATASYRLAGEDFWQFLLFLGMISVNLAVVNFLPIPVLDGGHMVFLMLEKVLGRPIPEKIFAVAMYSGLFLILALMVWVSYLDIRRQF